MLPYVGGKLNNDNICKTVQNILMSNIILFSRNFPFLRLLIEKFFRTCKLVTETSQSKSILCYFVPHIYQVLRKCHRFGVSRNCNSAIHICVVSADIIRVPILAVRDTNHCTTQLPKSL